MFLDSIVQPPRLISINAFHLDGSLKSLVTTYQRAYDLIHPKLSRVKDDQRPPSTFLYLRNEAEAVIAWVSLAFAPKETMGFEADQPMCVCF